MAAPKQTFFQKLLENGLVQGLSEDQVQEFFDCGKVVKAKPDTVFIREGSKNKYLFIVLAGEIEVYLPDTLERFSKVTLARRTVGDYVGEYSFLDAFSASASVRSVGPCILFQVLHTEAQDLFERNPSIGQVVYRNLLSNLVRRLRESSRELDMIQPYT